MSSIRTVCVFAASSEAVSDSRRRVAAALGRALAEQRWALVYGGGSIGLMGEVARHAFTGGAHVTGVIPQRLARPGIMLDGVSELINTETMRERKRIMDERSDAFVVLPGGIGTLEELAEVLMLKQLGYHDRAVIVLDDAGYWDPLLAQLQRMIDERFASPDLTELWQVTTDVPATIEALRTYRPPRLGPPVPGVVLETVEAPPNEA
ncbi:MAG: TIGR00730 family Rossman fold protein [Egibacteraceae bacterium]